MNADYTVKNDDFYQNFMSQHPRSNNTIIKYEKVLTKLCKANNKTLDEIITTCIDEQSIVTTVKLSPDDDGNERRKEIRFDINNKDASINNYLNQYENYCKKRGNKNITIKGELGLIRAFLKSFGVELPKSKKIEDDSDEWFLPTKDDFNYIVQDLSLVQASLLNFLTSTGMRLGDALSKTIGDFMEATSEYHDFVDVEDFIDNAPDDMIGQWEFEPQKTIKSKTKCITFNSTHTSNLILQNLRHIKDQYIPNINHTKDLNLKISKKYALFGSRNSHYETSVIPKSISTQWGIKNKKFQSWKINQIKQKIEKGEISSEDYDEEVAKIPKFHPHICRKFFCTTVANNCGDIRVCALLEGHSDGLPNDPSYVKKSVEDIKEIYINNIHDELSLANVETRIISNKETEELNKKVVESNAKIEALTNENAEKDKQIEELTFLVNQTQEQVAKTNKIVEDLQLKRSRSEIRNTITNYFYSNYRDDILIKEHEKDGENHIGYKKCIVICELAYELALENEFNFTENEEYLDSLIKKAIVSCSFNPDMILPKYDEIHNKNLQKYEVNATISNIIQDVIVIIGNHEEIWEMVKEDQKTLKDSIVNHIQHSNYDLDNITLEDKQDIAEKVIMEYLTVI